MQESQSWNATSSSQRGDVCPLSHGRQSCNQILLHHELEEFFVVLRCFMAVHRSLRGISSGVSVSSPASLTKPDRCLGRTTPAYFSNIESWTPLSLGHSYKENSSVSCSLSRIHSIASEIAFFNFEGCQSIRALGLSINSYPFQLTWIWLDNRNDGYF